jgi:hypothetical protein
MRKRNSIIILLALAAAAVLLGLILVNKGDGPVAGMIVSDRSINSMEEYKAQEASPGTGIYKVTIGEYNSFKTSDTGNIKTGCNRILNRVSRPQPASNCVIVKRTSASKLLIIKLSFFECVYGIVKCVAIGNAVNDELLLMRSYIPVGAACFWVVGRNGFEIGKVIERHWFGHRISNALFFKISF